MAQRETTGDQAEPDEGKRAGQYEAPRAFDLGPLVELTLGGIITGVPGTSKAGGS